MSSCPHCAATIPPGSNFCPACGEALSAPSEVQTLVGAAVGTGAPSARRILATTPAAAFAPGQVVADRYRIVGLLGSGGMGEVYRADDLKLGSPVALKFLPRSVERDPAALERFHAEVRTARQVSHPHVCRVYDIGEVAGRHFLSMEYVDGEDLATLLHRIGRLPPAKAIEIARQLCAGLAVAHDKGVVHRDLKPANVMIDGHGRARITDFGLAVLAEESGAEIAGTPAYMAPEQLAGQPATVQSDIYSLGLVLYEIFTGKKTFEAGSLAEWRRVHSESRPASPHLLTDDMDPMVERVILRCLEKDPTQRPRSATQVALALPGGDPLAAAVAAGETPSPEMVAAAGGEGALPPSRAWALLGAFVALLGGVAALSPHSTDLGLAPMHKSPDGLRDRARAIVERFGYRDAPGDEASWLVRDYDSIRWLADHLPSPEWRGRLARMGSPVLLHYRRGMSQLLPANSSGLVTETDPPAEEPGDIQVTVDAEGHLRQMRAMPPRHQEQLAAAAPLADHVIFDEAGLEQGRFVPVEPAWIPPLPFDARREWTGSRAEAPGIPLRLSVGTLGGHVVWVALLAPWSERPFSVFESSLPARIAQFTIATLILFILGVAVVLARRNLRLGRGDTRGAFRIAVICFTLSLLVLVSNVHTVSQWVQFVFTLLLPALGQATFAGGFAWLIYLALEPHLRRRMPQLLVGWARLLDGRWRDARVGRDVLIGLALGSLLALGTHIVNGLPTWHPFERQTTIPFFYSQTTVLRLNPFAALFRMPGDAILRALANLVILFVCRLFVRRTWLSTCLIAIVFTILNLGGENATLETPMALVAGTIQAIAISYLGLLTAVATLFVITTAGSLPIGIGFTAWYAPYSTAVLVILLGLAAWSFVVSLGGRSPFGAMKLDA